MNRASRSTGRRAVAALGAAIIPACSPLPDGDADVEEFRLIGTTRQPIPVTLSEDPPCTVRLVDGWVRLDLDGTYGSHYQIVRVCPDGSTPMRDPGGTGEYRMSGESIEFLEAGTTTGVGRLAGDTIIIRGPIHTLLFVRTDAHSR